MPKGYHHMTQDIRVRHEVAIQTVVTDSHLYATYCSVSSSLSEHAIRVICWCEASETM